MLADAGALDGFAVQDPTEALALWKIREDGAGLAGVSLAEPAYPGWEDAAVPPARLGDYLRDFDALLTDFGLDALPYGHFGDGCVHARIDFPLTSAGGSDTYRRFVEQAATIAASYGGSMSGEHGDGRARGALLPAMYSPAAIALFGQVKAAFDPDDLLNPGVLVDPAPVDADLRTAGLVGHPLPVSRHFSAEVHKCSGVGKCLANTTGAQGVMCPSFQATREEKDSTRGRARVLQELVNGTLVGGWRAPEVHDALDLCLSCKGCARDCPTGIDMASYKSIVLDHSYAGPAAAAEPLRARLAAALGPDDHPGARARGADQPVDLDAGAQAPRPPQRRGGPATLDAAVRRPPGPAARRAGRRPGRRAARSWCGSTRSPTASTATAPPRCSRCCAPRATRPPSWSATPAAG